MLRRVATAAFAVTVLPMATKTVHAQAAPINKDHHDGTKGFKNPWPSFVNHGFGAVFKLLTSSEGKMDLGAVKLDEKPEKVDINWNILKGKYEQLDDEIHATWLGHACIFLQMRGFNVLLDPIFSGRCSPVQFAGPKRYTDPPCKLSELPAIDAVIISHNHYDHLDVDTIKEIATRNPQCKFYVPLGNKAWFNLAQPLDSQGNDRVIELDWWESAHLKRSSNNAAELKFTCTPCQHFSGRGIFDRNKTLWASWCIEGVVEGDRTIGKVFFGGDTGYRTVPQGTKPDKQHDTEFLDTLPYCPVFKEIGEKVGPFDLALIPIGAYSPRWFMSPIHCSPEDAVELHRDVKSKHSIGIHWGTFVLTDEPVFDPPKRLKAAMENRALNTQDFDVLPLGGTFTVKAD